jgi:hypothetical protein
MHNFKKYNNILGFFFLDTQDTLTYTEIQNYILVYQ